MRHIGLRLAEGFGMRVTVSRTASLLALVALVGCAAEPPPPAVTAGEPVAVPEKLDTLPAMESEIGGLNEEAMDKAFAALGADVQRCVESASGKLDVLGGDIKLRLRIDRKGGARWAYVSASTLGDRDVEKCILESARAKSWPLPVGGEGLAEKSYAIDPSKAPTDLTEEKRVRGDVARVRAQAVKCKKGVRGSFTATAYLTPDGKVANAGVALPNEKSEDAADCMVEAVRKARFSRPGRDAKVSFSID
jgi:hypothetical protein